MSKRNQRLVERKRRTGRKQRRQCRMFAMLDTGCKAVASMEGRTEIHGAVTAMEVVQVERIAGDTGQYPKVEQVYRATGTGPGGLCNIHEASGRVW